MKKTTYTCDHCGTVIPSGCGKAHYFTQTVSEFNAPFAQPFWDDQRHKYRVRMSPPPDFSWTIEIDACDATECEDAAEAAISGLHEAHARYMALGLARVSGAGGATPEFFAVAAAAYRAGAMDNTALALAADVARAADKKAGGQ